MSKPPPLSSHAPARTGLGLDPETLKHAPSLQPGTVEEERTRRRQAMQLQAEAQLPKALRRADMSMSKDASAKASSTKFQHVSTDKIKGKEGRQDRVASADRPPLKPLGQSQAKPMPETVKCTVTPLDWTYPTSCPLPKTPSSIATNSSVNHPPSNTRSHDLNGTRGAEGPPKQHITPVKCSTTLIERPESSSMKSTTAPSSSFSTAKAPRKMSSPPHPHISSSLTTTTKTYTTSMITHSDECSIVAVSLRATQDVVNVFSSSVEMSSQNKSRKVMVAEIKATTEKVERTIGILKDMSAKMKSRKDFTCEDARKAIAEKNRLKALAAGQPAAVRKESSPSSTASSKGAVASPKLNKSEVPKTTAAKAHSRRADSGSPPVDGKSNKPIEAAKTSTGDTISGSRSRPSDGKLEKPAETARTSTSTSVHGARTEQGKSSDGNRVLHPERVVPTSAKEASTSRPKLTKSHTNAENVAALSSSKQKSSRGLDATASTSSSKGSTSNPAKRTVAQHDDPARTSSSTQEVKTMKVSTCPQDPHPKAARAHTTPEARAPSGAAHSPGFMKTSPLVGSVLLPETDVPVSSVASTRSKQDTSVPKHNPNQRSSTVTPSIPAASVVKNSRPSTADSGNGAIDKLAQPLKTDSAPSKISRPSASESTRNPEDNGMKAGRLKETSRNTSTTSADADAPKPLKQSSNTAVTRAEKVVKPGTTFTRKTTLPNNVSSTRMRISREEPSSTTPPPPKAVVHARTSPVSSVSAATTISPSRAEYTATSVHTQEKRSSGDSSRSRHPPLLNVSKAQAGTSDDGRTGFRAPLDKATRTTPSSGSASREHESSKTKKDSTKTEGASKKDKVVVAAAANTPSSTTSSPSKGEKVKSLAAFTSAAETAAKITPRPPHSEHVIDACRTRSSSTSSSKTSDRVAPSTRSSGLGYVTIWRESDPDAQRSPPPRQPAAPPPVTDFEEPSTRFKHLFAESVVSSVGSPLSEGFIHASFTFGREKPLPSITSRTSISGGVQSVAVQEVGSAKPQFVLPSSRRMKETAALKASISHWKQMSVDPALEQIKQDATSQDNIPSTSKPTVKKINRLIALCNASTPDIAITRTASNESHSHTGTPALGSDGSPEQTRVSRGFEVPADSPPRYSTLTRGRGRAQSDTMRDRKVRHSRSMNWLNRSVLQEYTATSDARNEFYKEATGWRSNPLLAVPPREPTPQDELLRALWQERREKEDRARRGNVFQRTLTGLGLRKKPTDDNVLYRTWNGSAPSNITWKKP